MRNFFAKILPGRNWKRWIFAIIVLAMIGYEASVIIDLYEPERMLVTIGSETTKITTPLKQNGYPDYVAALNKIQSEGIVSENNVFFPLVRVVGVSRDGSGGYMFGSSNVSCSRDSIEPYFPMLGIDGLPAEGEYLPDFEKFSAMIPDDELQPNGQEKNIEDELQRMQAIRTRISTEDYSVDRPWKPNQFFVGERWVARYEPLLRRLKGIEKRTKIFSPLYESATNYSFPKIVSAHDPIVHEVSYFLLAHAMRSLGKGERSKAIADVKIMIHLANCCYDSPSFDDLELGLRLEAMASENVLNFIVQDPDVTLSELDDLQAAFGSLKKPDTARAIDVDLRYQYLNVICHGAQWGFDPTRSIIAREKIPYVKRKQYDYDFMLRYGNQFFDKIVQSQKSDDEQIRSKIFNDAINEIGGITLLAGRSPETSLQDFFKTRSERTKEIGYGCLNDVALPMKLHHDVDLKIKMCREIHDVGFALARYYKKNGQYPKDFAKLKSEGIQKIPDECFIGIPCVYRCDGKGFILYSIGRDGLDSGGFNGQDANSNLYDDVAVYSLNRVPIAPALPMDPNQESELPEEPTEK